MSLRARSTHAHERASPWAHLTFRADELVTRLVKETKRKNHEQTGKCGHLPNVQEFKDKGVEVLAYASGGTYRTAGVLKRTDMVRDPTEFRRLPLHVRTPRPPHSA